MQEHRHRVNKLYDAIMEENLGHKEDMSKKCGSNFLMKVGDGVPGGVQWEGQPLHLAATYRKVKSMLDLLSAGVDPNIRDQHGRSSLHLIIMSWPTITPVLSKPEAKFQKALNCIYRQVEEGLQLLCEHGANVNAEVEGDGHTALHLSVRHKALSAVHILVSYGADVNAVTSSGMTPLHMAAGILHKDIIASLIKEGADVNKAMKYSGNTALHIAAVAMAMKSTKTLEQDTSCVSELLERGAEVDAVNKAGMTPLQEACRMGNKEVVDLLLRYGADINKLSVGGESCLFLFLNHRQNVRNHSLLVKLLFLSSPFNIYNQDGHLPSTLTLPCFFKQRDQLLEIMQQPRTLQDICKRDIYLKHVQDKKEDLRQVLPESLYDFVCNQWDNYYNIYFVTDNKQDSFDYLFGVNETSN